MSNEQREALAKRVPTTEVIRDAVTFPRDRLGEPLDISVERFEAWLDNVKTQAWDDGYSNGRFDEREDPRWISPTRNPYRKGE